jgi:CheY-like chemotaxis protein
VPLRDLPEGCGPESACSPHPTERTFMTENQPVKKKILIVEDEPGLVTYLETLLQDNGYETVSAGDGQTAFEKLKNDRPDLVTLDISIPQKSGVRFYRDLKENPQLANIPVIVVTAVTGYGGDPEEFRKFISTRKHIPPPEGFIAKPVDQQELLNLIKDVLP